MERTKLNKFIEELLLGRKFYAPTERVGRLLIAPIAAVEEIDWSGNIPWNTYKQVLIPQHEVLFSVKAQKPMPVFASEESVAWGVNILDLQAITLWEHLFRKDEHYQKRRKNVLVVGYSNGIDDDFRKYKAFHAKYEENILEHLAFDVFIEEQKDGNCLFFSGSEKGRATLEKYGISDFENIEFAGLVSEKGIDKRITDNRAAVELNPNHQLWDELAAICLACGKCSIICPTCFCYDHQDEVELDTINKTRQWSSCFYPEFSKVAGGHSELDSIKKKLYFWYTHKFVRIPDELDYYGCVGCMRCFKVCPVGINIAENLVRLKRK